MSGKISKIVPEYDEEGNLTDCTFYFETRGDEPFSSGEFSLGSPTRERLEQIEMLIDSIGVRGA